MKYLQTDVPLQRTRPDVAARHRRCLAKHQTLLVADHARILRQMRAEAAAVPAREMTVAERDLRVYDRITEVAS